MTTIITIKEAELIKKTNWILLWVSIVYIAIFMACFLERDAQEQYFIILFFLIVFFVNPRVHEPLHAAAFKLLTGKSMQIVYTLFDPHCYSHEHCTVSVRMITLLAPFIQVASVGILGAISYLLRAPDSISASFSLWALASLVGMSKDIYEAHLLHYLPWNASIDYDPVECQGEIATERPLDARTMRMLSSLKATWQIMPESKSSQ
jgi:hypothetical protein